jgi:hypothetical protein
VLFYACRTMAEAFILERELIETLRPRYNHNSLWNRVSIQLGYNSPLSFRRQYLAQPRPDSVLAPPGWYRPRPDPES